MNLRKMVFDAWKNLPANIKKSPEIKNYINPKIDTSPRRMYEIKQRNKKVREAKKEYQKVKNDWDLYRKFRGSKTTIISKPPAGSLYKAEQKLSKAKRKKVK